MTSRYKRTQKRSGGLTIEGRRNVLEALRSKTPLERVVIATDIPLGPQLKEVIELAKEAMVKLERLPRSQINRFSATKKDQGVLAFAPDKRFCKIDDLLNASDLPLVVVLDGVQDPQNLGAIARSTEALGGTGLVIRSERAASITPGALRASAGALNHLKVAKVSSIPATLNLLKKRGLQVVGTSVKGTKEVKSTDFIPPTALVIGNEHNGVSREVAAVCDELVFIPLGGKLESLNAAVAASIMVYEATKSRRQVR